MVRLLDHIRLMSTDSSPGPMMSFDAPVVAIVDDDVAVCDSTRFLLETYNFDVLTYQKSADFLRDDPEIDCLIVDYQMPDVNGLDFVSELRRRGNTVPAIMITATTDPKVERRATELGVRTVLQKPLANRLLLAALHKEIA